MTIYHEPGHYVRMLRDGGGVKRYHAATIIGEQTVAEHSFHVAATVAYLCPAASADLIKAALHHDLAEQVTGDIPAHVKWENRVLKDEIRWEEQAFEQFWGLDVNLTAEERHVLKWCDTAESLLFCLYQLELGNRHIAIVAKRLLTFINRNDFRPFNELSQSLFDWIVAQLGEHNVRSE